VPTQSKTTSTKSLHLHINRAPGLHNKLIETSLPAHRYWQALWNKMGTGLWESLDCVAWGHWQGK